MFEYHTALQLAVIHRSICLVRMLPCPFSGTLFRLGEFSVFFLRIDKRYIPLVQLRLFIHQSENTFRSCKCHNDCVQLLADLVDRHVKTLVEGQKACQTTERKATDAAKGKCTADNRTDNIAHISKLCIDRSDDIRKRIGIVSTLIQIVINFFEFFDILLFMTEYLDNLLAIHHLFDKAVDFTKIPLLFYKEISGKSGHLFCHSQHDRYHNQRCNRQRDVQNQHTDKDTDNRDCTVDDLRDTLTDHLAQSINIICINRHNIAVRMRIKIFDWQLFHIAEQIISQIPQGSLGHINHGTVLNERSHNTDPVKSGHPQNCVEQRAKIRIRLGQHRRDIAVNQRFHKHRSLYVCQDVDKNRNDNSDTMYGIIL